MEYQQLGLTFENYNFLMGLTGLIVGSLLCFAVFFIVVNFK